MNNFKVYSAGGNLTALITGHEKSSNMAKTAKKIMAANRKIEQVAFVHPYKKSLFLLEMMGDELCVNAASCAAFDYFLKTGERNVNFNIGGIREKIRAEINNGTVTLSLPYSIIVSKSRVPEGELINLKGMRLIITDNKKYSLSPDKIISKYKYGNMPAVGLVYFIQTSRGKIKINPWIWVKNTKSLVNETACGSGSIAACLPKLKERKGLRKFSVTQPSRAVYKIEFKSRILITNKISEQ